MVMQEINDVRERLEAAALTASGLAGTLTAAVDAFGVLLAYCQVSEDRSVELFAAFAFAGVAAAEGRHVLLTAPSLPPDHKLVTSHEPNIQTDLDTVADTLAGLAEALSTHLATAARHAHDPGDHAACRDAAREATRIHLLLAGDQ